MTELANKCEECEHYLPSPISDAGFCNRVDDPAYVFGVSAGGRCLYGEAGERISPEEIAQRRDEAMADHAKFIASGQRASEIVAGWPAWKRKLLG